MDIQQIKDERKRLGQSQWALAVRIGRSGTWLSLRENGYVKSSPEELEALSAALRLIENKRVGCQAEVCNEISR